MSMLGNIFEAVAGKGAMNTQSQDLNAELKRAVDGGNLSRAKELLSKGADENATDEFGTSMLLRAVAGDDAAMTQLLLDFGANPNARALDGRTGVMMAAASGRDDVVQSFIRSYAELGLTDADGRTAADIAGAGGYNAIRDMLEIKKQQRIFNLASRLRLKAEEKREELEHEKNSPITSLFIDGMIALAVLTSKIDPQYSNTPASKFGSPKTKVEALAGATQELQTIETTLAAVNTVAHALASSTPALTPTPPSSTTTTSG